MLAALAATSSSNAGLAVRPTLRVVRMKSTVLTCTSSAHGLADRRWRHAELIGCAAKAAVLGDAEECLHVVERAIPDCEVLLHSLSILSRIVVRGKLP